MAVNLDSNCIKFWFSVLLLFFLAAGDNGHLITIEAANKVLICAHSMFYIHMRVHTSIYTHMYTHAHTHIITIRRFLLHVKVDNG